MRITNRSFGVVHLFFIAMTLCVVCAVPVAAQSPDNPGRPPLASFSGGGLDSINLFNGNVMLNIPLASRPDRDLPSTARLLYDAQGWKGASTPWGPYEYYNGGWRMDTPMWFTKQEPYLIDCYGEYPFSLTGVWGFEISMIDGDGMLHSYEMPTLETSDCGTFDYYTYATSYFPRWVPATHPSDSTGVWISEGGAVTFFLRNGQTYTPYYSGAGLKSRNGNFAVDGPGFSGTVDWNFCHTTFDSCITVIDSIGLPDETSYQFDYAHTQGFLTKATLPSGGYVAFDYVGGNSDENPADNYVVSRRVSKDGTTEVAWTYDRSSSGGTRTITVTDPEGHQTVHLFTESSGLEYETQWKANSSSSPSKIVQTTRNGDGLPASVLTKVGSLEQVQTQSWSGKKPVESTQSDWYATGTSVVPLTRTTVSYVTISEAPYNDIVPAQTVVERWNGSSYDVEGKTEYAYDEYSLATISGTVPGYEEPWFPRRNPTTVRRYKDATNYVDEHFYYDILGNVVDHVDARGKHTYFDYSDNFSDSMDRTSHAFPTLVTDAEGHETETVYNFGTGLPVSIFDARHLETEIAYDSMDRVHIVTEPNGRVTTTTYSNSTEGYPAPSVLEEVTVDTGVVRKTETLFDKLYRPVQVRQHDPDGMVYRDTQYDNDGRIWKVSAPYRSGSPVWTETTYDELDRPVEITNPDSTFTTIAYTPTTVTTTDEAGVQRRSTINALGQLTMVEEPNPTLSSPLETVYTYNLAGLTGVTQDAQSRSFSYNWLGHLLSETHPETGTTAYTYLDDGLLYTRTDARSKVTTYSYDDIGRTLSVSYSDSTPEVTYAYDGSSYAGFLTGVDVDGVTASTFEYNTAGLLSMEEVYFDGAAGPSGAGTFVTQYEYDLEGRVTKITYPSGREVTRTYAAGGGITSGRLGSLHDDTKDVSVLGSTANNAAGQITARTLGSAIAESRSFNSRLQLTGIAASVSSTPVLDLDYGYTSMAAANTGRIRSRTDQLQPEHSADYTYDAIGRLTAASAADSSWSVGWVLDRYGNRTAQTRSGLAVGPVGSQSISYTYGTNRNTGWTYDAAGNVTIDDENTYTWDAENRLVQVNSSSNQYAYDAAGRRVKRIANDATTYYLYGLTGLQSEFSTSASLSNASAAASTDRVTYRVGDPAGTAVLLMDSSGVVRESNRVFPFGEPWQDPVDSKNTEAFTTYQHDNESGLDYAMARYYASRSGRFMTPDPGHVGASLGDPQSWNAYAYVANDPINSVDPDGLYCRVPSDPEAPCDDYGVDVRANGPGKVFTIPGIIAGLGHIFGGGNNSTPGDAADPCWDVAIHIVCGATGGPSIQARPPEKQTPPTGSFLGIRAPGQTFNQCMDANAGNYSLLGVADFASGANGQIADNFYLGFTPASNSAATVYNMTAGSLVSTAQVAPMVRSMAAGSVLTYGRRTSSIMNLNLAGTRGGLKGGFPALGAAPSNAARAGKAAAGALKLAVDVGLFLAEGIGCSLPRQ